MADAVQLVWGGTLRVGARPRIAAARPAAVHLDGDHALGPYAAAVATREALEDLP